MKNRSATAFLTLIFAGISTGAAFGQSLLTEDARNDLDRARELFNSQQDAFGPMDVRLIEPMEQLADQLMLHRQFDEAHGLLDRAMQIARVEEGLYTELQRPLLSKKIENFANRGDWEGARENMEHLLWLYTQKSQRIDRALIDDLLELSRVHLRGIAEDASSMQGYHFRHAAQIRWMAIGVAASYWGESDERLVPIVYEQLRQLHLQTVALWQGGSTSYALRKVAPGSEIMRDRSDVDEAFYLTGMSLIDSLHTIYSNGEASNAEARAMTNVYLADWHILFDKPQAAENAYRSAYQELLAAGVAASLVKDLFSQPLVIPDTEFYSSVAAAVTAHRSKLVIDGEESTAPYLAFNEWSSALPNVRNPIAKEATGEVELESNFAMFSFSLAGVNKVSRWFSHRFVTTLSMIEQAELLAHYLESPPAETALMAKFNSLTFRPKLVDGEPQQVTGRLRYNFAEGSPPPL